MKKLLSWKSLALLLLAVLGISLAIFLAQPSQATSTNDQRMIELSFIDEVKSPEELGLDYLRQKPPELIADLVHQIRYTRDLAITQMTDNIAYAIPLGSNTPFAVGELADDDGGTMSASNLEMVGTFRSGKPEPFLGRDAINMFDAGIPNGGRFSTNADSRQTIVADASGSLIQARRIAIVDLIVRDMDDGKYYLLPNIRAASFCRDALNSIRNRTYRRYNGNLRGIRL